MNNKIVSIENLKKIIIKTKKKRKKVVLCHGVFDLLHVGHINHFQYAKSYGDIVIVSVTPDKYVNKGPGRPAFNEQQRLKALASLECVDYVILNRFSTAVSIIKELKPNIYCKGQDYKNHRDDITGEIKNEIKKHNKELESVRTKDDNSTDVKKMKEEREKLENEIRQKRKDLESGFRELKFIKDEMAKSSKGEGTEKIVDAASAVVASMNQKLQNTIMELNAVKKALENERGQRKNST